MLVINMLGKMNLSFDGERIDGKLSSKLAALLCFLLLNIHRDVSKDKIAAYLWPDSDEESAKYNLRYTLWMIKKNIPEDSCGRPFVLSAKDYCRINREYEFECDKLRLEQYHANRQATVEQLLELKELFKGDFLEGLYLKNCVEFNEMILFERVVCQSRQVEILKELVGLYETSKSYEEELQVLGEIIAIEPYNEEIAYRIIDLMLQLGNRVGAIHYYKNFEAVLRRNLNISPNTELKYLYGRLLEDKCPCRSDSKEKAHASKKKLRLAARCLKGVDYFPVADAIREIMGAADKKYMLELDKKYIFDLSFIQNELLLDYEKYISGDHESIGFVPAVRIINAFCRFLEHAADVYDIEFSIINAKDVDPVSQNIWKLVEESCFDGLHLRYN